MQIRILPEPFVTLAPGLGLRQLHGAGYLQLVLDLPEPKRHIERQGDDWFTVSRLLPGLYAVHLGTRRDGTVSAVGSRWEEADELWAYVPGIIEEANGPIAPSVGDERPVRLTWRGKRPVQAWLHRVLGGDRHER